MTLYPPSFLHMSAAGISNLAAGSGGVASGDTEGDVGGGTGMILTECGISSLSAFSAGSASAVNLAACSERGAGSKVQIRRDDRCSDGDCADESDYERLLHGLVLDAALRSQSQSVLVRALCVFHSAATTLYWRWVG